MSDEVLTAIAIAGVGAAATVAGAALSQRGARYSTTLEMIAREREQLSVEWARMREETRAELVEIREELEKCEQMKVELTERIRQLEVRSS